MAKLSSKILERVCCGIGTVSQIFSMFLKVESRRGLDCSFAVLGLAYQGLGNPNSESLLSPCIVCSSVKCAS